MSTKTKEEAYLAALVAASHRLLRISISIFQHLHSTGMLPSTILSAFSNASLAIPHSPFPLAVLYLSKWPWSVAAFCLNWTAGVFDGSIESICVTVVRA